MNQGAANPIVVKVGGSLYDLPDLAQRLRAFLNRYAGRQVLLVAGGGPNADIVRAWDAIFQLGEERAHWLALRALDLNAHFLAAILPEAKVVDNLRLPGPDLVIVKLHAWARADEDSAEHLPHSWRVTSDSIAARIAQQIDASELILLKSADMPADWKQATEAGLVDEYFPEVMARCPPGLRVQMVNLRTQSWRQCATL